MDDELDHVLNEMVVPWDTSDLPPNVRITSPSLKIAQAKKKISAIIAEAELRGRIDELENMLGGFNDGLQNQEPNFKYIMRPIIKSIEQRLKELRK